MAKHTSLELPVSAKTIGVVVHSAEGGALCFRTMLREGASKMGPHMHPHIVLSAVPMGLSMGGWESGDHEPVAAALTRGVRHVADAGADFYVCPDNTAHIVLERLASDLPIPGLHVAHVVCAEAAARGWSAVGLLGTEWTMTGPVYARTLESRGLKRVVPPADGRERLHCAILEELCQGVFRERTTRMFREAIRDLGRRGAEGVILGCTEIPLIVTEANSPLPPLDGTRLLARHAVEQAIDPSSLENDVGWLRIRHESIGTGR